MFVIRLYDIMPMDVLTTDLVSLVSQERLKAEDAQAENLPKYAILIQNLIHSETLISSPINIRTTSILSWCFSKI